MADITVELVPDRPYLPVTDEASDEFGELNYIFYPGISACQHIRLTNTTGGALTPIISFDEFHDDSKWWKTMRIYTSCSGVLPSGVDDTQWTGEIAASGTQDLYVYSDCRKEGWSHKYNGSYWTNTGFAIANEDLINDSDEDTAAIDCDAAGVNSTLVLDLGENNEEEYVRLKFSIDAIVNAEFDIQYSDDGAAWTTVYEDADLSITGLRYQITFWWDKPGAHRYWRIIKTNAAVAGGNITELQWILFEAHDDAKEYGVYGDHKCNMIDSEGYMDDFEWRTSVMVNIDVFARQNYTKPIGKVGKHTQKMVKNIEKYGQTLQLFYVPTITMSYTLNAFRDWPLEKRVWDVKCIVSPQKRHIQYTQAADGLAPSMYRYDQRQIYLLPHGPDSVGWYQVNYDFWHQYGHSYFIMLDNHCYQVDDPQPIYFDNEIIAIAGRLFLQSDMTNLATDPRDYKVANREGEFTQLFQGMRGLSLDSVDPTTPEQRPVRWVGAVPSYLFDRGFSNRPDTYSHTAVQAADATYNGEVYLTEEWLDPANTAFQTAQPVVFGNEVRNGGANHIYFQMQRFYYWLGYCEYSGNIDPFNTILQLYYDEDCTIPVQMILQDASQIPKVENEFDYLDVELTGEVNLDALGGIIYTDGHWNRTPTKLYVRYRREDGEEAYYYPT